MRPGQEAPDELVITAGLEGAGFASMRPGQEAPDELVITAGLEGAGFASMRPGQEAPDECALHQLLFNGVSGFNEAGARSPG